MMWEALREAVDEEMERDPTVCLMGEDVGHYGGSYKVTFDLYKKYGDLRLLDTPICENGFMGVGIGAAMTGLRVVIEGMNMGFLLLAYNQISNNAGMLHYTSGGQFKVPVVIRGPGGVGRQLGAEHSQRLESYFQSIPGVQLVACSTAANAKALLKSAIRSDNPVSARFFPRGFVVRFERAKGGKKRKQREREKKNPKTYVVARSCLPSSPPFPSPFPFPFFSSHPPLLRLSLSLKTKKKTDHLFRARPPLQRQGRDPPGRLLPAPREGRARPGGQGHHDPVLLADALRGHAGRRGAREAGVRPGGGGPDLAQAVRHEGALLLFLLSPLPLL
jgi:hypothetical protein